MKEKMIEYSRYNKETKETGITGICNDIRLNKALNNNEGGNTWSLQINQLKSDIREYKKYILPNKDELFVEEFSELVRKNITCIEPDYYERAMKSTDIIARLYSKDLEVYFNALPYMYACIWAVVFEENDKDVKKTNKEVDSIIEISKEDKKVVANIMLKYFHCGIEYTIGMYGSKNKDKETRTNFDLATESRNELLNAGRLKLLLVLKKVEEKAKESNKSAN